MFVFLKGLFKINVKLFFAIFTTPPPQVNWITLIKNYDMKNFYFHNFLKKIELCGCKRLDRNKEIICIGSIGTLFPITTFLFCELFVDFMFHSREELDFYAFCHFVTTRECAYAINCSEK